MHEYLNNSCSVSRDDTKGLNMPTVVQTFPDKFMDPKVFRQAREVSNVQQVGNRVRFLNVSHHHLHFALCSKINY